MYLCCSQRGGSCGSFVPAEAAPDPTALSAVLACSHCLCCRLLSPAALCPCLLPPALACCPPPVPAVPCPLPAVVWGPPTGTGSGVYKELWPHDPIVITTHSVAEMTHISHQAHGVILGGATTIQQLIHVLRAPAAAAAAIGASAAAGGAGDSVGGGAPASIAKAWGAMADHLERIAGGLAGWCRGRGCAGSCRPVLLWPKAALIAATYTPLLRGDGMPCISHTHAHSVQSAPDPPPLYSLRPCTPQVYMCVQLPPWAVTLACVPAGPCPQTWGWCWQQQGHSCR